MILQEVQNRISWLMTLFVTEIRSHTAMNRTDINHVSETILIPIFKEIYPYNALRNVNATENENYPGIDLADDAAKVAIQVTSTTNNEKIKHTLKQFEEYKLYKKYNRLIVYILTERQESYSDKLYPDLIKGKFEFSQKEDIYDYRTLLRDIQHLQLDKAQKILQILEKNIIGPTTLPSNLFSAKVYKVPQDKLPKFETVTLNLIEIEFPDTIYSAEIAEDIALTSPFEKRRWRKRGGRHSKPSQVVTPREAIQKALATLGKKFSSDWVFYENKIFTFHDLNDPLLPIQEVIEPGTVEPIGTSEFYNLDKNYERVFKSLLRFCLQQQLFHQGVKWQNDEELFFFYADGDVDKRKEAWVGSRPGEIKRTVFERHMKAQKPDEVAYYKHFAFGVQFINIGSKWYLAVKPDWFFSFDGYKPSFYGPENLKWLKRKETNAQVYSHVRFTAYFLKEKEPKNEAATVIFNRFLKFGNLITFDNAPALIDREWNPTKIKSEEEK